jgi:hypothetical protein
MTVKAIQNVAILVKAGAEALTQAGWSDEQIIAKLPMMIEEAEKFLLNKRRDEANRKYMALGY